jgi:poly-beta-1,6-N-acetyl-D-glucosamine synthase
LIDYMTTVVTAIAQKRPRYLLFGLGFLFLRYVDSFLYIKTLPKAYLVESTGSWKSPARR